MSTWLGDYAEDATVHFMWNTNNASGASITRATNGTVSVYKDNGLTQSVAGITDTEDFDSLTGIHACTIDTSADAFYAVGSDYSVVLSAATVDGQVVNAALAHFSIENRAIGTDAAVADAVLDELTSGHTVAGSAGAALGRIGSNQTTVQNPIASDGTITIYQGDDYTGARALIWTLTGYVGPNVNGQACTMRFMQWDNYKDAGGNADLQVAGTVAQSGDTVTVTVELSDTQTASLSPHPPNNPFHYRHHVYATAGSDTVTLVFGKSKIVKKIPPVS